MTRYLLVLSRAALMEKNKKSVLSFIYLWESDLELL